MSDNLLFEKPQSSDTERLLRNTDHLESKIRHNSHSSGNEKKLPFYSSTTEKEQPSYNDSSGRRATKTLKTVTRLPVRSFGHTLKNLDSDSTYDVTVAVQNKYGWSENSKIFSFYTEACEFCNYYYY